MKKKLNSRGVKAYDHNVIVINEFNLLHWSDTLYWSAKIQAAEFCKFDSLKHPY